MSVEIITGVCPDKLAEVRAAQPELGWETQEDAADTAEIVGFAVGCEAGCPGYTAKKLGRLTVPTFLGGGPVCGMRR